MRNNTGKKKQNKIAGFCKRVLIPAFAGAVYVMSQMTVMAFAAGGDTSAVTKPLDNLKTLVIAVIGAVGVINLAKNVMEFAQAFEEFFSIQLDMDSYKELELYMIGQGELVKYFRMLLS